MAMVALKRDIENWSGDTAAYKNEVAAYTQGIADYNKAAEYYNNSFWKVGNDPVQFRREFGDTIKYYGVNYGGQLISKKAAPSYIMTQIAPTQFGSNLYTAQYYGASKPAEFTQTLPTKPDAPEGTVSQMKYMYNPAQPYYERGGLINDAMKSSGPK